MPVQVYLSPHLDDAVLSCGGLIARQVANDEPVTVVTVCAGDTPVGELTAFAVELHRRWGGEGSPVAARRAEDRMACGRLGASVIQLEVVDAVYRRARDTPLYPDEASIFGPLHPADLGLVAQLAALLAEACSPTAHIYCPAAVGGHVDHRLTRLAAERLGRPLWYYPDLPYSARGSRLPEDLAAPPGLQTVVALAEEEVQSWVVAVAEYRSQFSTFWPNADGLYKELAEYIDRSGGIPLWAPG
jgi:LmbE family N-acetylglucosaminyl deacetylase